MITRDIPQKLPEENDLVIRFRAGDEKAYTELYHKMYTPLCFYTYKLIQDEQEAQCIVAETFQKLWKIHANFDAMPSIKVFLYKVCYREGCDFLKYGQKKKPKHIDRIEDLHFQPAEEEDILSRMVQNELIRRIFAEIDKMPGQRQKVLQLFFAEGLTTKEVAERLSMKEEVVRSTKAQALAQLRKQLGISVNHHQLTLLLLAALEWQRHQLLTAGLPA